ncbi:MAG: aldo/keto reductase [Spirochaetaceae bacterium]|jgi:predicted aldo/keto reductase-like oxidoreductase|nr:aldo/keto reductase [Spirochaetaceae bacterium]
MAHIRIGKTGARVEQNGFGALPIQRIPAGEAVSLLRKAYHGGIDFYDTARGYTDSEEKLGKAFAGERENIFIATKTPAGKAEQFWKDLETSLGMLKTDHIDLYQFHNPPFCPKPGDPSGLYDAMAQAKKQGKIRFIGITNHRLHIAGEAIASGLYDTLQFPLSYLSAEKDRALVAACTEKGMGFIAMKALAGGLITNSAAAYAWAAGFENLIPIWGIQREKELDEFISYIKKPPVLTENMQSAIERDRAELRGAFCRGCGYCMPCPRGIEINMCARASLLLRRAPLEMLLSERGKEMMKKVEDCIHCGQCAAKCPYGLDTPALLQRNYQDYREVLAGKPL